MPLLTLLPNLDMGGSEVAVPVGGAAAGPAGAYGAPSFTYRPVYAEPERLPTPEPVVLAFAPFFIGTFADARLAVARPVGGMAVMARTQANATLTPSMALSGMATALRSVTGMRVLGYGPGAFAREREQALMERIREAMGVSE